jgi:hypothetical protein
MKDSMLGGYCELKSPRDDWTFDFPRDLKHDELRVEVRPDAAANNLARQIVKASPQFAAVNPNHALPNILVIVNHARRRTPADLHMALTGIKAPDGRRLFLLKDQKQREVLEAARNIDLYFWIDAHTGECQHVCPVGAARLVEACDLLGIEVPNSDQKE